MLDSRLDFLLLGCQVGFIRFGILLFLSSLCPHMNYKGKHDHPIYILNLCQLLQVVQICKLSKGVRLRLVHQGPSPLGVVTSLVALGEVCNFTLLSLPICNWLNLFLSIMLPAITTAGSCFPRASESGFGGGSALSGNCLSWLSFLAWFHLLWFC